MFRSIAIVIACVWAFCAQAAEVKFYKTYEDYQKGNAEVLKNATYLGHNYVIGKGLRLNFKSGGEELEMKVYEYWGFTFDDALFRTYGKGKFKLIVRLVSNKKIHYYENGIAHLKILGKNEAMPKVDLGLPFAFSLAPDSEIIQSADLKSETRGMPQYQPLVKCVKKSYDFVSEVRDCVREFDK